VRKDLYSKNRCLWSIIPAFATAFLLSAMPSLAEEKTTKMNEIVVTATRTEKALEDSPGSVAVVTKKDMEKRIITTVDESLNTTAGVLNQRGKGLLENSPRIMVGGITGYQRTLVQMDGMTVNNAYTGNVSWNLFTPEDIERVEVVKGPFSSLYGGYAMGGVVNVITKLPEKREFTVKEGYGTAWSRGDAPNDMKTFYASYGDKINDKFRIFIGYSNQATNGYVNSYNIQSSQPTAGITGWSTTSDRQGNRRYLIGNQGQNDVMSDGQTVKLGYDFSDVSKILLSYMRAHYTYGYGIPDTYLRSASGNPVYAYGLVREVSFMSSGGGSTIQNIYSMKYETELSSVKIKFNAGLSESPTDYYVTPTSTSATISGGQGLLSSTTSGANNADLQMTVPAFERHILTFGGSYRNGWSNSTDMNIPYWRDSGTPGTLAYQSQGKDRTYALFVQDEILLTQNLTAYIGAREDWWETYDGYANQVGTSGYPKVYDNRSASSFSPKGALVYKPFEQTAFRTSAGTAFRPPTVYELYRTTTSSGITYEGAPNLKPETSASWDIGIDQGLWRSAKIKARYFENYISDLIYAKTVSATLQQKINAGKAESKGIELEAEQRFDKWLRLFANLTYTGAYIKENSAALSSVDKRMTYVPDVMFNVGGDFEKGPVGLTLIGRYVGKRYALDDNSDKINNVYGSYDPFFTADAKIRYKLFSWATASFSVNNIANEQYYGYYLSPGRSWFLDLTLKF
jgi:iron complex outermembrane recepter protein